MVSHSSAILTAGDTRAIAARAQTLLDGNERSAWRKSRVEHFKTSTTPISLDPPWGMLADDLTGACDAAVKFAQEGFKVRLIRDRSQRIDPSADLIVASTESRSDAPAEARSKVHEACRWMQDRGVRVLYKKIDSTLRGNAGDEIAAVMETCGFTSAVATPAFPAMGRVVSQSRLRIVSEPESNPLDIRERLNASGNVMVADASTPAELEAVAERALSRSPTPLLVGSAGLASPVACLLAARLGRSGQVVKPPRSRKPLLFVVGSIHPVTTRQLEELKQQRCCIFSSLSSVTAGLLDQAASGRKNVVAIPEFGEQSEKPPARYVELLDRQHIGALVLSGGDTAALVCDAAGVGSVDVIAELAPGIPWGYLRGGTADATTVVTKGGGFGGSRALVQIADGLGFGRSSSAA